MINEKSLKIYKHWKRIKWLINMGVSCFDFFGKKYDKRMVTPTREAEAVVELKRLNDIAIHGSVIALQAISKDLKDGSYVWTSDPLKGYFDYKSNPLMTVAKRSGDCDDYATLWCHLFPSLKRYAVFADEVNKGHVVAGGRLIGSSNFVIVSNLEILGSYEVGSVQEALLMLNKSWFKNEKEVHCIMEYAKEGHISKIMVHPF